MKQIAKSIQILQSALLEKQMSAVALEVRYGKRRFSYYDGEHAHRDSGAICTRVSERSIFDLASLTKIFVTSNLLHKAKVDASRSYAYYFGDFPFQDMTIRSLMEHNSGLKAHVEFFKRFQSGEAPLGDLEALKKWIYTTERSAPLGGPSVYSDLGFMLLGFLLEKIFSLPLAQIFQEQVVRPLALDFTGFIPLNHSRWNDTGMALHFAPGDFVATEKCPWRNKTMQGEVHDDNCWSMGGIAGHAGLFSTARECLKMLDEMFWEIKAVRPDKATRSASGKFWDGFMVYPGLRAFPGEDFAGAIGHTGFVGTSAWHSFDRDLSVVLLTNRVHPSRDDNRWIETRLKFHQSLWNELK